MGSSCAQRTDPREGRRRGNLSQRPLFEDVAGNGVQFEALVTARKIEMTFCRLLQLGRPCRNRRHPRRGRRHRSWWASSVPRLSAALQVGDSADTGRVQMPDWTAARHRQNCALICRSEPAVDETGHTERRCSATLVEVKHRPGTGRGIQSVRHRPRLSRSGADVPFSAGRYHSRSGDLGGIVVGS